MDSQSSKDNGGGRADGDFVLEKVSTTDKAGEQPFVDKFNTHDSDKSTSEWKIESEDEGVSSNRHSGTVHSGSVANEGVGDRLDTTKVNEITNLLRPNLRKMLIQPLRYHTSWTRYEPQSKPF